MPIQVGGIISGLETNSIIEQLLEIEQEPIQLLQTRQEDFTVQLTAYGLMESKIIALNTALESLGGERDFDVFSASSTDEAVFIASASTSATPGTFDVTVSQLAKSHKLKSAGFAQTEEITQFTIDATNRHIDFRENGGAELTATLTEGIYTLSELVEEIQTQLDAASAAGGNSHAYDIGYSTTTKHFTIESSSAGLAQLDMLWAAGTHNASSTASLLGFTAEDDAGALSYTSDSEVGEGTLHFEIGNTLDVDVTIKATDTIEEVAEAINDSDAAVSASVIYDGTEYVLSMTARNSGEDNMITITATDVDGGHTDTSGLSRLVYDAGITENLTQSQAARDALIEVDGIDNIKRPSNTISDVIAGVTLTLRKAHTDPATESDTVTITRDTGAITEKINAFVAAYNDMLDFFSNYQHKYDEEEESAGVLLGDATTNMIRRAMRGKLNNAISGITSLSRLADLGITLNQEDDPRLEVTSGTLSSALNDNFEDVMDFFTQTTEGAEGFAVRMMDRIETMIDRFDGTLTARKEGITNSIGRLDSKIEYLEDRIETTEANLWARFNALELLLAQYQSTGDFLSQQIAGLQNLNKSISK